MIFSREVQMDKNEKLSLKHLEIAELDRQKREIEIRILQTEERKKLLEEKMLQISFINQMKMIVLTKKEKEKFNLN